MKRVLIKLASISLVCICALYMAAPALAQSTVIKVDVLANGDARWTTEKMLPLDTAEDIAAWDATAAKDTDKYLTEFDARMRDYVARISASVGRTMSVKGVNVTVEKANPYALSDNGSRTYGVIRYDFTWTGFAMASGDVLEVGDAFVDGFLLNDGDSITFILPTGYDINDISPAADDLKKAYQPQVKWTVPAGNGSESNIRLFSSGEPSILLQKTAASGLSLEPWVLIPVILISALAGFGAAFVLLRTRTPAVQAPPVPDRVVEPDEDVEMPEELPPVDPGRFLSDEERVIKFLEEAGGQMFQSDLVRKTDFSKSKLSMVLSDLKEKGVIIKIKKGKENLIRLNRPADGKPEPADVKPEEHAE